MTIKLEICILTILALLLSCSPANEFSNNYVNDAYKEMKIKKALVVGMAKEDWKKKVYENEFRQQLMKYNVEVLTAWQELPKGETISKEVFYKYFSDKNIDAVIIVMATGTKTEETMTTGGTSNVYVGFYGLYVSSAQYFYSPVTTSEETVVSMKTNIYETSKGDLIWSVKSQSYEPQNTGDVIKTVSAEVVNELAKQGYLIKK